MDNPTYSIPRLTSEVSDLKSEHKLTSFRMQKLDQSIDDIKLILEKLSLVYTEQSLIQKDILMIYKEVAQIQLSTEEAVRAYGPLRDELTGNVSSFKSGLRVLVFTFSLLQGIVGWGLTQEYTTIKTLNVRVEELRSEYRVLDIRYKALDEYISKGYTTKPK